MRAREESVKRESSAVGRAGLPWLGTAQLGNDEHAVLLHNHLLAFAHKRPAHCGMSMQRQMV